ncbi:adenylate cyclase type 9-like [Dendronephthya gigantea]|uniref:adenylate cyclase type 9-like n=1 Tax=Dendronephthya gigantea TaxID=151771 RepID=UPI00106D1D9E|nr:adenylate cyclase type 9-like [Dendronephthya gigantea]
MDSTAGEYGNHSRASSEADSRNPETRLKSFNALVKKDRSFSQVDTRNNKGCVPLYFERASSAWWYPKFDSSILEKEYQEFSFVNNRRAVVKILIYLLIAALIWMIYFGATQKDDNRQPVLIAIACFGAVFFAFLAFVQSSHYRHIPRIASLFLAMLIITIDLLFFVRRVEEFSGAAHFTMCASFILIIYTMLHSIPLFVSMIILALFSIVHEILYAYVGLNESAEKIVCTAVLHLVVHIIAIQISFMAQVRDRSTFWKFGQRLIAKREAEVEKSAKDSMIRSVMPETIATEIVTNFQKKELTFRPFKMHRMEDVSILFADIVGFTQMSSNKTAEQLVGLLSDLFGRFDQLTYEHQCEKISTLGDAYYCVAGCPEPISYHAFCCVDMGLAMVKTIKEFDEENNEQVGMRVGIHTGTVLCGIIGNKRFKFDVWSNDVTLANKMETAGVPGKVHITQATKDFLDDTYIYEDGNGSSRHVALEGITTYLILGKKRKHEKKGSSRHHKSESKPEEPFKKVSIRIDKNDVVPSESYPNSLSVQIPPENKSPRGSLKRQSEDILDSDILNSSYTSEDEYGGLYNDRRPSQVLGGTINEAIARFKLRTSNDRELVALIKDSENSFANPPLVTGSLWFRDRSLEESYHKEGQDTTLLSPTVTTFASPKVNFIFDVFISILVYVYVVILCFIMLSVVGYISIANYIVFAFTCLLEIFFLIFNISRAYPQQLKFLAAFSKLPGWLTSHISGTVLMCLPVLTVMLNFTVCDKDVISRDFVTFSANAMIVTFIHFCNFTQLISILKSALVAVLAILFIIITTTVSSCGNVEAKLERDMIPTLILLTILIFILNYRNDIGIRMKFLVDAEAAKDKKEAKMNKAQADWLLESIIPRHVIAELQEEKLYSRNYENVGVIFASIVNFGDFYEENFEGGKECIRVLNELVGDFDDLLERPDFSEVEKIKTVNGSTFMAASGLNNSQGNGKGKNHLKQLITFALAMMTEINNFNDHMLGFKFILRVGFNAGPVTAGVIGSNKLFYDIWGDTVNIASRMDSTGVEGRVQVSEASKNLLEEFFDFEERGEIPVKGKGTIKTSLLVGPLRNRDENEINVEVEH